MKQSERASLSREKIMGAAMDEFGTKGYRGGSMGSICKTGINKGLLYHFYPGKDELYLECLKVSCQKLVDELQDADPSLEAYIRVRTRFYQEHEKESRILFECLLDPPGPLKERINEIMVPVQAYNARIHEKLLSALTLRKGITREKADTYLKVFQKMFNSYFSSPAMQDKSMEERVAVHEQAIPLILDCVLYGIAEKKEDEAL